MTATNDFEMTHPELDKLEAALEEIKGVCFGCPTIEQGKALQLCYEAARAHLAAQRQGGDAVLAEAIKAVNRLHSRDDREENCMDYDTIRAALLSAQGGVPGDVLSGVRKALLFYADDGIYIDDYGYGRSLGRRAKEALTLLTPYLNNGRGG